MQELKQVYEILTAFEYDILYGINKTKDIGMKIKWCDLQKEYCIDEEPTIKQSEQMLYHLDQKIKNQFFNSLLSIRNKLDAKHQCLRR